jgi:hypothetical protein
MSLEERRIDTRIPVELLINKYIDGHPYLVHGVNISWTGVLVERVIEPTFRREMYPLEIGLPDEDSPIWVWSLPVWTSDKRQALRFIGLDTRDERALARFITNVLH